MAIKKLNATDPGVKRPVRCSDFQDIWSGLYEALASGTIGSTTPQIITGLTVDSENDYVLTSGLLAYNGMLYYFDSTEATINEGDPIYAGYIADADRNFSDGSVQPFSYSYVLRNTSTGLTGAVNIGQCTISNIAAWRVSGIPDASIPSEKLEQIPGEKLVSVPQTKIEPETFRIVTTGSGSCRRGEVLVITRATDPELYTISVTFADYDTGSASNIYGTFRCIVSSKGNGNASFLSLRGRASTTPGTPIGSFYISEGGIYEVEYIVTQTAYLFTVKELMQASSGGI